ncbi:hypothetical protein OSTOST_08585 [Ostertagia ostertagi]
MPSRCWLCKASRLRVVNVAATGRRILECANRNCLATIEYTDLPEGTIIEQEKATYSFLVHFNNLCLRRGTMDGICEILQKWYIPPKKGWKRSRIHRLNMCQKCCTTLADVLSFVVLVNGNLFCYSNDGPELSNVKTCQLVYYFFMSQEESCKTYEAKHGMN